MTRWPLAEFAEMVAGGCTGGLCFGYTQRASPTAGNSIQPTNQACLVSEFVCIWACHQTSLPISGRNRMGANRAGVNLRRRRKRQIKNLKTQWAAEDRAAEAAAGKTKKK